MDWLLHALVSRLVWEIILVAGGAGGLAYVRAKAPTAAPYFLYGIAGATCVAILIFTFTGRGFNSKSLAEVTPENVEENIKTWADHLAMSLERQNAPDGDFFSYVGRVHGGDPVEIFRAKEKSGYLQLKATIKLSREHEALLGKLSKHDSAQFLNGLSLEMARLRMSTSLEVAMNAKREPITVIATLQKAVPIANLNEGYFADSFDEVTEAVAEVRAAINLDLGTAPQS